MKDSKRVVYAALLGNLSIAAVKIVAAWMSGSSAMLSEGIHSLVDTSNQGLLLYGIRRSEKPADRSHPFGYGRELYFWSFVVALLVFALGAGVSFYEGISHILHPHPANHLVVNLSVLAVAALFESISWTIALREVRRKKGPLGYLQAIRKSKDPGVFIVLLEDTAALAGLLIAFVGLVAAEWLSMPELDGVASLGIGGVLSVTAFFLARETKGLLIGESASASLGNSIMAIAGDDPAVRKAHQIFTIHMGPEKVLATLILEFEDEKTVPSIERSLERIESSARRLHPELMALFFRLDLPGEASDSAVERT